MILRLVAAGLILLATTIKLYAQNIPLSCNTPEAFSEFPAADSFFSMALSPDSQQLAVAARSGIYLFDPSTLTLVETLICSGNQFEGDVLAWSSDSQYLAQVKNHYDASSEVYIYLLRIWDVNHLSIVAQIDITNFPDWAYGSIGSLSWSPDSNYLAMSTPMYIVSTADITDPNLVFVQRNVSVNDEWTIAPSTFAWSTNDTFFASANGEKIHIWDPKTWTEIRQLHVEPISTISPGATTLAWTSAGYLAAGSYSQPLHIWETRTWAENILSTIYQANIAQFLPTTSVLAFAGDSAKFPREWRNRIITILDISSTQVIQRLIVPDISGVEDGRGTYVQKIEWFPDGHRLLSLQSEGMSASTIHVWDIESGDILASVLASSLN